MLLPAMLFVGVLVHCKADCIFNSNSGTLQCKDVEFNSISSNHTDIKEKIKSGIFDNCKLRKLEAQMAPFSNMLQLDVSCEIEELSPTVFKDFTSLDTLNLADNKIAGLPSSFSEGLTQLRNLDLSNNKLRVFSTDCFRHLNNLKSLHLGRNRIENFEPGTLASLANLEELHLNNNAFQYLYYNAFYDLKRLRVLDLSGNYIPQISERLFKENKYMEKLDLKFNLLNKISKKAFAANVNLRDLDVSNCKLENLEMGVFEKPTNLVTINVSGNQIAEIPKGIFNTLTNLETLVMFNMGLKNIPDGSFEYTKKFKYLDVSQNALKALGLLFFNTSEFEFLNISRNQIETLPIDIFQWCDLKIIDLSYNRFETIEPNLLNNENLEKVCARGNRIYHLDSTTFATVGNPLKYLDIRDNRMVFLDKVFFEWVANLEVLEITGNPWDCKCFEDLMKLLSRLYIEYTKDDYFDGKKSICVALSPFDCNVDMKDIKKYYEEYQKINSLWI